MTKEEYKDQLDKIYAQMNALKDQKKELQLAFLKEHVEYKAGDKVFLTWPSYKNPFREGMIPERKEIAYIASVSCSDGGILSYAFYKAKKDGSRSSVRLHTGFSGGYTIESFNN